MADDLSAEATAGIWATSQATDACTGMANAMTAPGSVPAAPVVPSRADPDPAEVTADRTGARPLVHGEPGGEASHGWDDVSGRRQPWGPG